MMGGEGEKRDEGEDFFLCNDACDRDKGMRIMITIRTRRIVINMAIVMIIVINMATVINMAIIIIWH